MSNLITFLIAGVGITGLIADTLRDTRPGR
jgi:hypothetical protein